MKQHNSKSFKNLKSFMRVGQFLLKPISGNNWINECVLRLSAVIEE